MTIMRKPTIAPAAADFIAAAPDAAKAPKKTIGKPMGRRPLRQEQKEPMRILNIRIEAEIYESFFDACTERDETMTAVIRRAIAAYMQRHGHPKTGGDKS